MNNETTSSGEPTFGVEELRSVIVEDDEGTQSVAYHDGDTWWGGHFDEMNEEGTDHLPVVQLIRPPVRLVRG